MRTPAVIEKPSRTEGARSWGVLSLVACCGAKLIVLVIAAGALQGLARGWSAATALAGLTVITIGLLVVTGLVLRCRGRSAVLRQGPGEERQP